MKRLLTIAWLLLPLYAFCQTTTIKHKYYTTTFDEKKHIPYVVEYTLTKKMLGCGDDRVPRSNVFTADPKLPESTSLTKDYAGSEYDRGHNMPAEDNRCNAIGMKECFYFTNMFPQTPRLNRGVWKRLEVKERLEATERGSVKVYIGSYGKKETIGPDEVVVPAYCWKVLYSKGQYEAYVFPNTDDVNGAIKDFATTVDQIEKKTGFHFSDN